MQQSYIKKADPAPGSESFNRPPRIWTSLPQGTVNIPPPPKKDPLPAMPGMMSMLMSILMMTILIGISILVNRGSMQQLAFLLPMAIFSIMTPLANLLTARANVKKKQKRWKVADRKYRKVLAKLQAQ